MATSLPSFASFDAENRENIAIRWQRWFMRFENLLIALDVNEDKRKRALLLHYIGESTLNIFETLPDTATVEEFKKACDALNEYFKPQKNTSFEIFKFRKTNQNVDETIDQYHVRLVQMAKYCEFTSLDKEIKAQIELGTISKQLRRYAFRHPKITLAELFDYGRILETSEKGARGIENQTVENTSEDVNAIQPDPTRTTSKKKTCFNCGYDWPHLTSCPAKGKTCNNCRKPNHFARCCKSRSYQPSTETPERRQYNAKPHYTNRKPQVKHVDEQGESSNTDSDEYIYTVQRNTPEGSNIILPTITTPKQETINNVAQKPNFYTHVKVNDTVIRVNIDSGASVNIIDSNTFDKLASRKDVKLTKSKIKLFAYGSKTPLNVKGCFQASAESAKKISLARFYVINGSGSAGCLLSGDTAIDLGLLKLNKVSNVKPQSPTQLNTVEKPPVNIKEKPKRLKELISKYDHLFQGIGKFTDHQVHLHIDKTVPPTIQKARRIPFAMRDKLSK